MVSDKPVSYSSLPTFPPHTYILFLSPHFPSTPLLLPLPTLSYSLSSSSLTLSYSLFLPSPSSSLTLSLFLVSDSFWRESLAMLSHTFSRLLHTLKRSTASGWNTLNTEFSLNPVFSSCVCVRACMHVVQACVHKTHLMKKSGLVGISLIPRLFVGNGQSKRLRCCAKLSTGHISCAGVTGPADVCDSRRPLSNSSPPTSQACYCLTFSIILMSHFCSIALVFLSSS